MRAWVALSLLVIAVNIGKAQFTWDYTGDPTAPATQFTLKCGPTSGTYPISFVIPGDTARSQAVAPVIQGPGSYVCVVTAGNAYGESVPSNEVSFDAGNVPHNPTNLQIGIK